ncbi:hypothetical protein [Blautia sp.]|uniref:hypothetical protein n=1 Tax=Blautia sp. TaxID=1955243 RepID=UPI003AF4CA77
MRHILETEKKPKGKEQAKKQVPLRLSATLWNEIAQWAEDDFRSMNGQIEYLLTECVKYRKKHQRKEDE